MKILNSALASCFSFLLWSVWWAPPVTVAQQGAIESTLSQPKQEKENAANENSGAKRYDPREDPGFLHEIAEPLAKILKFRRNGELLSLDVPPSFAEGDAAFREIRSKGRGGGGGSGSQNYWSQYVSSQFFAGRIQRSEQNFGGNQKKRPDSLNAEFLESADNNFSLEVRADTKEDFSIRINGGLAPYYLQVVQTRDLFSVQEASADHGFAGKGVSFEDFCRENPNYVQDRLIPILNHFGVASPITRFNKVTRDHVLALLSPADEKQLTAFQNAFQGLESKDYEEREEATQQLLKDFDQWKDVLRYAAGSDRFSLEVRARLQKLVKEKSSEDDRQLIALVATGDLTNDAEYLAWLLGQCKDENPKKHVVRQLKNITKQDFQADDRAWNEFLAKQRSTRNRGGNNEPIGDNTIPEMIEIVGYLPQMAEPTANLLNLKTKEGKLGINRKSWAEQFNGETIETLFNRLQDQLQKSNLPKRWLNPGSGRSLKYVSHEHVLLEHIQSAIPPQRSRNYYSYGNLSGYNKSNLNQKIEQPHLLLELFREELKTEGKTRQVSVKKTDVFRYSARERRDSRLEFSFVEKKDTSLHLTIASAAAHSVFHLVQQPDGKVACHWLSQGDAITVRAANFSQLYQNHRPFVENTMYPIFARFGIQVAENIGGPLKIKNASAPASKK